MQTHPCDTKELTVPLGQAANALATQLTVNDLDRLIRFLQRAKQRRSEVAPSTPRQVQLKLLSTAIGATLPKELLTQLTMLSTAAGNKPVQASPAPGLDQLALASSLQAPMPTPTDPSPPSPSYTPMEEVTRHPELEECHLRILPGSCPCRW